MASKISSRWIRMDSSIPSPSSRSWAASSSKPTNTSEIRVSVLLDEGDVDRAVRAIHAKFFDEI